MFQKIFFQKIVIILKIFVCLYSKLNKTNMKNQIKAINKKYQSLVNKAVKYNNLYDELNRLRDEADGNGDDKAYRKYNKACEVAFDKYLNAIEELPKRERQNIEKRIY